MTIRQVILDFDGTCTLVENVQAAFLARYRELVASEWSPEAAAAWDEHERLLRAASPGAGWTLGGAASAPAAADPYILSGEVLSLLVRRRVAPAPAHDLPARWFHAAYDANPAPWRPEARAVIAELLGRGVRVAFVSNSAPDRVRARVAELGLDEAVPVHGSANKFRVVEPSVDSTLPAPLAARFAALPAAMPADLPRPVYLRRAQYFAALAAVWTDAGTAPEETLVVGDVFELDLAMPAALGCWVTLVRRAPPYATYPYELAAIGALGRAGSVASDLAGIPDRVQECGF